MYIRSSPRGPNRDPNRTLSNELLLLYYQKFLQYLYRDNINKAINSKFDPKDNNLFKEFLKC